MPTSASSVLDFSTTFSDNYNSRHFNLAETALVGLEYAKGMRDPRETDLISQVHIQPTTWFDRPTSTYYHADTQTIMLSGKFEL